MDPAEPRREGSTEWGHGGGTVGATQPAWARDRRRGGGDQKHFLEKGGLCRSNFQKAFVFFHTETIKALKQGFGAALNEFLHRHTVYWRFMGARALCGVCLSASRQPRRSPWSVEVACVNYGDLFWPWILRPRLFLLSCVSAAPLRCWRAGCSSPVPGEASHQGLT